MNIITVHVINILFVVTLSDAMYVDAITAMLVTDLHAKMLTNAQPVIIRVILIRVA